MIPSALLRKMPAQARETVAPQKVGSQHHPLPAIMLPSQVNTWFGGREKGLGVLPHLLQPLLSFC